MEKNVDHYMRLPYAVGLERDGDWYRAWARELPGCTAEARATEGVGKLWERLEEAKRRWITRELELGRRVPEPEAPDPFWERFPDGIGEEEAMSMLHRRGAVAFPLRVLGRLWLRELEDEAASQESGGTPRKEAAGRREGPERGTPERGARPVRLGESGRVAWIGFDGPRTERGYRAVEVLDQPPRTEAAVVAALTVLEASVVRDTDFERMRRALLGHAAASGGFGGKDLQEVLVKLPEKWFSAQKATVDAEEAQPSNKLSKLKAKIPPKRPPEEEGEKEREKREKALKEYRKALKEYTKRYGQSWERWERVPRLWKRSLVYTVALLRHRRPGFDALPLEEQLDLLDGHRKRINRFLEEQRRHAAFLEYGTPKGLPKTVLNARNQVEAAVLADVAGLNPLEIAGELGLTLSDKDVDRYQDDSKIPKVTDLARDGWLVLNRALSGEGGWRRKAEEMKAEAARYKSLSKEGKETEALVDALAEATGWTRERARTLCLADPETARFLAWPTYR